jgi:hypothetical protein
MPRKFSHCHPQQIARELWTNESGIAFWTAACFQTEHQSSTCYAPDAARKERSISPPMRNSC